MKKKSVGIIALIIASLGLAAFAYAATPIKLIVNGNLINTDVQPRIESGRVLAPVRAIAEAMGADVTWEESSSSVIIDSKNNGLKDSRIMRLEYALAPKTNSEAVNSWAEAVKTRNGAWQYAVMSPELRKQTYQEFVDMNWSTGVSSPWIESYKITEQAKLSEESYLYTVEFTYTDSTQSKFKEQENVIVKKYDNSWLIEDIEKVEIKGEITKVTLDKDKVASIFVENKSEKVAPYDKATLVITPNTKIYKGYSNVLLSPSDLKLGMKVEAEFEGPIAMIYPAQGAVISIRVLQ